MKITVGDIVKCMDFEGNDTCYKIGRVKSISDILMCVTTIKDVWDGEEWSGPKCEEFTTPLPGEKWFEWESRIQVLG